MGYILTAIIAFSVGKLWQQVSDAIATANHLAFDRENKDWVYSDRYEK